MNPKDLTSSDLPVQDLQIKGSRKNQVKERQLVSALARKDLEDKYLTLREDYTELKKLSRTQDEKMKQMATKLVRLFNDKKKMDGLDGIDKGPSRGIETTAYIEDLQLEIGNLQTCNEQLKNKLSVAKQQLQTHAKRQTPYDSIKPRVKTGLTHSPNQQRIKEQMRVDGQTQQKLLARIPQPSLPQPRYGHSLLEESRIEKRELENLTTSLQEQINLLEKDREALHEQQLIKQNDYEESELKLRSEINDLKKARLKESSELIRLEREVKDKCTKLEVMQGKFANLEQIFEKVKGSNEKTFGEMENLNLKLKEEQATNSMLRNEMRENVFSKTSLSEKEELISDLKNENCLLKETHEKLLQSTFDSERERRFRIKERDYQLKITQLEALTKADVLEKNELLDKLSHQRDEAENMQTELKQLRIDFYSQKQLSDNLAEKMKFFSKESNIDLEEVQEAILLIKSRKEKISQDLNFLEKVDEDSNKDLRKELLQLQTVHADTMNELEKTRGMLQMQHKIGKDYQKEVSISTQKMDEIKRSCDTKMQEYAQMLDMRAERIKKLEGQIRDIAYGTKQYKIKPEKITDLGYEDDEVNMTHELERGQNILEIHIGKLTINKDALKVFGNAEPRTFVTVEFFEYEVQATPVVTGQRVLFNFTSQFIVVVDDFFLHYIAKETTLIELHQAVGAEYKTLASGKLRINEILDKSQQHIHGVLYLYDLDERKEFALLEYWVRLQVPMEQALRLYKERSKALGYISSNSQKGESHANPLLVDKEMNKLKIIILQCSILKASSGKLNAYAVYKFFDFVDHDTEIVVNSTNPQFNDEHTFPVAMSEELDNYLKTSMLNIYVFDDNETDLTAVTGMAKIPLVALSQDKSIHGAFQLLKDDGTVNGSVDVSLQWQQSYLPASIPAMKYPKLSTNQRDLVEDREPVSSYKDVANHLQGKSVLKNELTSEETSETPTLQEKELMNEDLKTVTFKEDIVIQSASSNLPADIDNASIIPVRPDLHDHINTKIDQRPVKDVSYNNDILVDTAEDSDNNDESDASLMEKELRKTVEATDEAHSPHLNNEIGEDTLFEEPISDITDDDDDEGDVVIVSKESMVSPIEDSKIIESDEIMDGFDSVATSDSEGVVVSSAGARALPSMSASSGSISIEVASLTLYENASLYKLENSVQLYVAYRFLDEDPESLETPDSLPLPPPNRPIYYNFKRVFHVGKERNEHQFQMLMNMLLSEERLRFNIVAEPNDGEDDCEDIGFADVSFLQMLQDGRNLFDEDIEVLDSDEELIGLLTVTVEALDALKCLYN